MEGEVHAGVPKGSVSLPSIRSSCSRAPGPCHKLAASVQWLTWVPQMKRTDDSPKPCVLMALMAAAATSGWLDSPK